MAAHHKDMIKYFVTDRLHYFQVSETDSQAWYSIVAGHHIGITHYSHSNKDVVCKVKEIKDAACGVIIEVDQIFPGNPLKHAILVATADLDNVKRIDVNRVYLKAPP